MSVGGGTPVYYNNMDVLNEKTITIYLRANISTLAERLVKQKEKRPIIARIPDEDLPEFIAVDLSTLALNDVLHMTDIQLPKGVHFAVDPKEGDHDHPVVSVHLPRIAAVEEEVEEENKS